MAKGGGASRPRFRLLPTVLLTAAILVLPTVVYALGPHLLLVRHPQDRGHRHEAGAGAPRGAPPAQGLPRPQPVHGDDEGCARVLDLALLRRPTCASTVTSRNAARDASIEHRPAVYALAGGPLVRDRRRRPCDLRREAADGSRPRTPPRAVGRLSAQTGASARRPRDRRPRRTSAAGLPAPTGKAARLLAALQAGPPGAALRLPRLAVHGPVAVGTTLADRGCSAPRCPSSPACRAALRARLAVVEVTPEGQITLRFAGGPVVVWGGAERALAKTLALGLVLEPLRRERPRTASSWTSRSPTGCWRARSSSDARGRPLPLVEGGSRRAGTSTGV